MKKPLPTNQPINTSYIPGALHQNNGNISSIVDNRDSSRTQTFAYDSLNRITSGYSAGATGTFSWGETYSIDPWGNLNIAPMGNKAHGGTFANASDNNNRPLGFTFDAAGNLTNTSQYVYDPENRIQVTAGTAYTYDADGQRVLKSNTSGTALKRYWMGNGNVLAEADGSGNLTAEYIYFNGKRIARIDLPANTVHYYLSDHLGSSTKVINAAGVVEEESDFTAYGSELSATSGANRYKFTGKERDSESQLDYFGARYYSNLMGRFMTPDWAAKATAVPYAEFADPQSLNLYTYVRNAPLSHFDPDGHDCNTCQKIMKWLTSNHSASSSTNGAASQTTSKTGALETKASIASGQASASASYGKTTAVSAGVSGSVASTTIKEGAHSTTEMSALSGEAKASVGASGDANGVRAAASASAGAYVFSASQTETVNIGPVTITGAASGNVGVGASASGKVGTDGVSGSIGLTPIAGGSLSLSISWGHVALETGASASSTMDKTTTKVDKPEVKLQ